MCSCPFHIKKKNPTLFYLMTLLAITLFLHLHNQFTYSLSSHSLFHLLKKRLAQVIETILVKVTSVFLFVKYNGHFLTFILPNLSESCGTFDSFLYLKLLYTLNLYIFCFFFYMTLSFIEFIYQLKYL